MKFLGGWAFWIVTLSLLAGMISASLLPVPPASRPSRGAGLRVVFSEGRR